MYKRMVLAWGIWFGIAALAMISLCVAERRRAQTGPVRAAKAEEYVLGQPARDVAITSDKDGTVSECRAWPDDIVTVRLRYQFPSGRSFLIFTYGRTSHAADAKAEETRCADGEDYVMMEPDFLQLVRQN